MAIGRADPVFDYASIIKKAINNSPQYKFIGYQLKSRQMAPAIQLGRLLPRVDIGGAITSTKFVNLNRPVKKSIQGLVTLTQPLYDYGAYKDLQSAQEISQFAQQDYRSNYQQFLYDVSYAYFNLARTIKNVKYNSYNLKSNKQSLNEVKNELKAGVDDKVDYKTTQANYYIAEADYEAAKREEKVARAELHKFINSNDDVMLYKNNFKIKEPVPDSVEAWEELTLQSNPAYLGAMHTKESKYYNYQSATSSFMPKVDFEIKYAAGYNRMNSLGNPLFDAFLTPQKGNISSFYFGLNLTWNIFAGGTDYAQLKQTAYDYQASEFNMIQIGRIAQNDAMYAFRFVQLKKKEIESLRKSVESAKFSYQMYKERYRQGITTVTQYFIVLNQYYQLLIKLNNAEFDYIMGFLSLYKTAGILTADVVEKFNDWLILGENVEV
ncbi:MAG: TolC family protein FtlC [Francisella sp.]